MAEPNFFYVPENFGDSGFEDLELDVERAERVEIERIYESLKAKGLAPGEIKVPKNWDIRKKDIKNLNRGGFSLSPLESIYYGIHNLFVPNEMMDLENPSEIFANYLGAGVLKRNNFHLSNDNIPGKSFSDLVKYINNVAYGNIIFAKFSHELENRFPTTSGFQEKRLSHLSGDVKRRFCKSFVSKYNPSNREEPNNPGAFLDPLKWNQYIEGIYRYFSRRFASR